MYSILSKFLKITPCAIAQKFYYTDLNDFMGFIGIAVYKLHAV